MAVTKQAPECKTEAQTELSRTLSRLDNLASSGDWDSIREMCHKTKYPEVGMRAADLAAEAKNWGILMFIGIHSPDAVAKYAADKTAEAKKWFTLYDISKSNSPEVIKYAQSLFKKATTGDIDELAATNRWMEVGFIGNYGEAPVAKYAIDKAIAAKEFGALNYIGASGPIPVAKYAIDKAAECGQWGSVAHFSKIRSDEAANYAKEKLAQHEKGEI